MLLIRTACETLVTMPDEVPSPSDRCQQRPWTLTCLLRHGTLDSGDGLTPRAIDWQNCD